MRPDQETSFYTQQCTEELNDTAFLGSAKRTKEQSVFTHLLSIGKQICIYEVSHSSEETSFPYLSNYVRFL